MENSRGSHTSTKIGEMSQDINKLEIQTMAEKDKLHNAENEEKMEEQKKNILEVRRDELKRSIEFYKLNAKKIRNKLAQKSIVYSKFSMADECYDKLLKIYAENYLRNEFRMKPCTETSVIHKHIQDFQKQAENLLKQSDIIQGRIDENSITINSLLERLQFPNE